MQKLDNLFGLQTPMPITVQPEIGIPFLKEKSKDEFLRYKDRARAAVNVIRDMIEKGVELQITPDDRKKSRDAIADGRDYIIVKEENAAALLHLDALLNKYDFELVDAATRVHNYVVNRLLEETENTDPKIRLRALELLGKSTMARVFSETVNVNMRVEDISEIDGKLSKLSEKYTDVIDVPVREVPDNDD